MHQLDGKQNSIYDSIFLLHLCICDVHKFVVCMCILLPTVRDLQIMNTNAKDALLGVRISSLHYTDYRCEIAYLVDLGQGKQKNMGGCNKRCNVYPNTVMNECWISILTSIF